jgi:hypothetical protein
MFVSKRALGLFLISVLTIGVIGCDSGSSGGGGSMSQAGSQLETEKVAEQEAATKAAEEEAAKQQAAANAPQVSVEPARTEAGRAPIGEGGYLVAIAGARRHVLNKVDDLAWTQAVQHFQATEGRLPKDHAEFMSKVIEPNEIDLGFKEENQEFLYDPSEPPWGTLYVVEKMTAAEPAPQQ